jgi:hypothetical protein
MDINTSCQSQAWWYAPVIPALRKLRQEDLQFKTSLGYTARPCLKKNQKQNHVVHLKYIQYKIKYNIKF